ncbi:MAG: hypothetical protein J0L69_10140 [Bacteroidetes bacterium]|nr:hypothetical protein [Bacteroidota bacterium]
MPVINNIVRFSGHILVILILLGTLSALSLSSVKWIESKSKQTEINLNQDAKSDASEEKSNYELEESLLHSIELEHKFNLCYSQIYYKYQNVSLIDGLSGLNTPPPRS